MVKISIVTPSFNQGRYIRATIESVLSQQGDFQLEHLVMDGGSTDETLEILRSYGDRLRWRSEPDKGQSDALNKGLALATGDIHGWLNSDDVFEPGCLATVARVFTAEPETQWLYGKVRIIDEDGREKRRWVTWYKNRRMRRYSFARLLRENWISQMGVFWRRSAWEQTGPFRNDLHRAMDYDYWLRLGLRWPARFVDQYLAAFRWYSTSKTGSGYVSQTQEALEIAREHAQGRYKWSIRCHQFNRLKIIASYKLVDTLRLIRR